MTYLGVHIIQVVDQVNICKNWTVQEGGINIIMSLVLHILMLHCDCNTAEQGKNYFSYFSYMVTTDISIMNQFCHFEEGLHEGNVGWRMDVIFLS